MTYRKPFIWLLGLLLAVGFLGRPSPAPVTAQGDPASQVFQLVNRVRASYGLAPFQWNSALAAAAQNQASFMAANSVYSHTGAGGSSPQSRAAAAGYAGRVTENIVGGTDLTPGQGVIWWQNSPVHFNAMISTRYTEAGVGFAAGSGQNFYALVVGNPSDAPPARGTQEAAAAPVFVAPIVLSPPREDGSVVHTVLPGHTAWAIAARYEITLEQLYLYNNLNEDSLLSPGDELLIRLAEGQAPPPTPTPPVFHLVRAGETLWTIAARYRTELATLLWLNGLTEDDFLQPGDEIKIRLMEGEAPPPTPTPQQAHIIQTGDTAWGIALRYGLTLEQLLSYNNLAQNAILQVGKALLIVPPTPAATPTPEATPTLEATPTAVATLPAPAPLPGPTASPLSVAAAPPPQEAVTQPETAVANSGGNTLAVGGLIVGLGVTLLLGAAALILRSDRR